MSEPTPVDPAPTGSEQSVPPTTQPQRNRSQTNSSRRQARTISSNSQSYVGECEDIGHILALRSEKFDKKIPFQVFLEKISTYTISNLKDSGDIQPLFTSLSDPNENFASKFKPTKPEPGEDGEVDEVDHEIYCEEVKQFVQRKINMRRNIEKAYGLIWGQCSAGLQTYIKGLSHYETSATEFKALWLLREIKKATSGIDDKANAYVSMHNAISQLYRMKQGN